MMNNKYLILKSASMAEIPDRFCQLLSSPSKMPAAAKTVAPLQAHLGSREAYLPVWYVSNI